jgi:cysteine desulfurase
MSAARKRIYLDHNATSPLRPEAARAARNALNAVHGNPSSLHSEGRAARAMLERAREQVADLTGSTPAEVVFTSGGSEAIAAAVRGVCDRAPHKMRRILVSSTEHSAVLEAARLASRRGFVVVEVPCGKEGRVSTDAFRMHLDESVALAVLHWANNETGVLQPVEEAGQACREAGVPFLIDAVQSAGRLPLDPRKVFADLIAISGHKLGGPQGTGALIVRRGISLAPLIGGNQETRRRGGTPAVPALVGFGAAADAALSNMKDESKRILRLRAKIETRLRELYPNIRFHGQASPRLPNTVNFALPGLPGETLAIALDLAGVAISTGSACASGAVEPSHVIRAMGFDEGEARSAVRVSLGWSNSTSEINRFLDLFPRVVQQVRKGLKDRAITR